MHRRRAARAEVGPECIPQKWPGTGTPPPAGMHSLEVARPATTSCCYQLSRGGRAGVLLRRIRCTHDGVSSDPPPYQGIIMRLIMEIINWYIK